MKIEAPLDGNLITRKTTYNLAVNRICFVTTVKVSVVYCKFIISQNGCRFLTAVLRFKQNMKLVFMQYAAVDKTDRTLS